MHDTVVVDSVLTGSVLVTFHVESRTIGTAAVVHTLQTAVQAAADNGAGLPLGGSTVMTVNGVMPFVHTNTMQCNKAWFFDGPTKNFQNFTGICAGLAFLLLFITAINRVRRLHWQFFIRSHIFFALVGLYCLFFHFDFGKLDVMAPFLLALAVDYAIRGWRLLRGGGATLAKFTHLGESIVVLQVDAQAVASRHTEPGQYCYLQLPQFSRLQWHPMTIVSAPGASKLEFCIKGTGDWGRKLL
eukprot:SAG31_NODE_2888_length_4948_cov_2.055475_9_plen_242_part_01